MRRRSLPLLPLAALLLAPPPARDGPQTRAEIEAIVRIQASSSPERVAQAGADVAEDVWRFASVLGPGFARERLPLTDAFAKVAGDEGVAVDPAVKALVKPSKSGACPSGHTTVGYLVAIVLADMLPERRRKIFERAADFGYSRMVGGMHYRSDVEAGRIVGTLIAQAMTGKAAFKAAYAPARAELRAVVGLPG